MLRRAYALARIVQIEDCVNDETRAARHGAVEPRQHSGGGVAADARVSDADVISPCEQQGFQARRPGYVGADSPSGSLARPQSDDLRVGGVDARCHY